MPFEQLIYTDRPRGQGLDPGAAGYQIQACSAGLGPELRRLLGSVCMHYGDAVYRHAPQAAADRETAWRATAESLSEVPEEVLAAFPVIWSYDLLADGLYSLTRVRYAGFTHDGRTGNFFAHALVFTPGDLAPYGGNPLALARSGMFLASSPGDGTSLPVLEGADAGAAQERRDLDWEPYREHLPALAASLAAASSCPLLLGLSAWEEAAALVEALLDLLPPSARSRTTFCTYESDRHWLPNAGGGGRPDGRTAAHHLLVLCPRDGRPLDLRADEYRSGFAVFNFAERRFSDTAEPGSYARFAAACTLGGDRQRLRSHHDLAEELGLGREPAAWNALVPAAALGGDDADAGHLAAAARALAAVAASPGQAAVALERLLSHVRRLAGGGVGCPVSLFTDLETLAQRAGREAEWDALAADLLANLFRAAREAGRTAEVWERLARPVVGPRLDGEWNAEKERRIRELLPLIPVQLCPEGNAWLNVRLLKGAGPTGDDRLSRLREAAAACPSCREAEALAEDLLQITGGISDLQERAEALGWMAEAAYGTAPGRRFLAASRGEGDEEVWRKARKELLAGGAVRVPCREMVDECLRGAAEGEERKGALPPRWEPWLKAYPALLDQACRETAAELASAARPEEVLPLAEALLAKQRGQPAGPAIAELAGAVVLALPMAPLPARWSQVLPALPPSTPPAVRSRLQVLRYLHGLDQRARDPGWSARGLSDRDAACQAMAELDPADRDAALEECLGTLAEVGVTTPEEAEAVVRLFRTAGAFSPGRVAEAVARLLEGRDRVTCVQVAMAFARCGLDGGKRDGYGAVVGALLERCGRPVRELFEEHLARGFSRHGKERERRLRELCEEAGLAPPKPAAPPVRNTPPGAADGSAGEPGRLSGALSRARGLFGKLLGGPPETGAPGRRQERG